MKCERVSLQGAFGLEPLGFGLSWAMYLDTPSTKLQASWGPDKQGNI